MKYFLYSSCIICKYNETQPFDRDLSLQQKMNGTSVHLWASIFCFNRHHLTWVERSYNSLISVVKLLCRWMTIPDLQQAHWSEFRTGSIRTIYHLACAGNFTSNIRLWHYISEMSATISHMNPAVKFNKVRYKHNHITQRELSLFWGGPGEQRPVIRSTAHNLLLVPAQWRCAVVTKWRPPRSLSQQCSLVKYPHFIGIYWSFMVSGAVFSDVSISKIVDECLEIRSDIGTGVFKPTVGHWWGTPANVRLSDVFRGHCNRYLYSTNTFISYLRLSNTCYSNRSCKFVTLRHYMASGILLNTESVFFFFFFLAHWWPFCLSLCELRVLRLESSSAFFK